MSKPYGVTNVATQAATSVQPALTDARRLRCRSAEATSASDTTTAPRRTEPWTFAQSASSGTERRIRLDGRRTWSAASTNVQTNSGSAGDCARICHVHGAANMETKATMNVERE